MGLGGFRQNISTPTISANFAALPPLAGTHGLKPAAEMPMIPSKAESDPLADS